MRVPGSKVVILGAGGVGKSSLVVQYLQGCYSAAYRPTIEDSYCHILQLPNGLFHTLEIIDTAGAHCFPAMKDLSIRSGKAFVIVFALNSEQSFYEAQSIWKSIRNTKDVGNVPVVLTGNKVDLSAERKVSWRDAHEFCSNSMENGSYIETSAKYNLYVNDVFYELLLKIIQENKEEKASERPYNRLRLSLSSLSMSSRRKSSGSSGVLNSSIISRSCTGFADNEASSDIGIISLSKKLVNNNNNVNKCSIL